MGILSEREGADYVLKKVAHFQLTTSNMRIEIATATVALIWLSNSSITKAFIVTDQTMLRQVPNSSIWHEWILYVTSKLH